MGVLLFLSIGGVVLEPHHSDEFLLLRSRVWVVVDLALTSDSPIDGQILC